MDEYRRPNLLRGVNVILPVNLELSVPPNVSSPLLLMVSLVGSKETATKFSAMVPWVNRLPVTVGIS